MRSLFAAATIALASAAVWAQPAVPDQDHAAHHPERAAASAAGKGTAARQGAKAAPKPAAAASAPTREQMDAMMKSMQEMHDRMMSARSAEDRAALMPEHTKTMQDGMAMMGRMQDGSGPARSMGSMSMDRRMDMMQMMMQMMMDSDAARGRP